ncbi:MAG: type II toxin-antitoxin system VapC family toxin [Chloroflexi bacterium]|nr:type II toxin-antitoxin system VapC family toxin [Chloroflexota bacterium]
MYLFDTEVLSQILKPAPVPGLIIRLAALAPEDQFTSAITVGEMVYGAHHSSRRDELLQKLNERVWPNVWVLSFDRKSGEVYGRIRSDLERAGTPLAEPDLRIASIALANDLTVVTGNVRHFGRLPDLRVENWLQPD